MQVVLIILAFFGIGAYEAKGLIKNQCWKELGVMIGLLTVGLSVSLIRVVFGGFPRLFLLWLSLSEKINSFLGLQP
ncbi:MAG: hypothetical protein PHV61_01665 [Limnochordia bacterium]|nr:hypothetical protein [Limnochordia bacterium]MDD2628870.1 hypothetical protein [Limnochordia bacterium]MDD4516999.1 hypothetical protein [Limnochordia bacterium]